jgi:hypothetical protein
MALRAPISSLNRHNTVAVTTQRLPVPAPNCISVAQESLPNDTKAPLPAPRPTRPSLSEAHQLRGIYPAGRRRVRRSTGERRGEPEPKRGASLREEEDKETDAVYSSRQRNMVSENRRQEAPLEERRAAGLELEGHSDGRALRGRARLRALAPVTSGGDGGAAGDDGADCKARRRKSRRGRAAAGALRSTLAASQQAAIPPIILSKSVPRGEDTAV